MQINYLDYPELSQTIGQANSFLKDQFWNKILIAYLNFPTIVNEEKLFLRKRLLQ